MCTCQHLLHDCIHMFGGRGQGKNGWSIHEGEQELDSCTYTGLNDRLGRGSPSERAVSYSQGRGREHRRSHGLPLRKGGRLIERGSRASEQQTGKMKLANLIGDVIILASIAVVAPGTASSC